MTFVADRTYQLVIAVCRLLFRALGLRFDVRGAEHVPAAGPAVLAANHVSFLDFMFVGLAGTRRGRFVRFLAIEWVFRAPGVGAAMRAMGHIAVDRAHGEVALRNAVHAVRAGELVGVFPEATISRAWTLKEFRPGAAALAIREQVPLVPVVVWGGQRVLTVDGRVSIRRGKTITLLVGQPLRPPPTATVEDVGADLRTRLDALLVEAMDSYPDRPRNSRDRWWLPASRGGSAPTPDVAALLDGEAVRRVDARAAARAADSSHQGCAGRATCAPGIPSLPAQRVSGPRRGRRRCPPRSSCCRPWSRRRRPRSSGR